MTCNGYNHPPDCTCNFKGGHHNSHPPQPIPEAPLFGSLAPPAGKVLKRRRTSTCRKCGMPIHYIPGSRGGSFIAAGDGSFLKHNCPKAIPQTPLSLGKSLWRKHWYSAALSIGEGSSNGQLVSVTSLIEGGPFQVRIQDGLKIDPAQPAVCRWSPEDDNIIETAYVDVESEELTATRVRARRLNS